MAVVGGRAKWASRSLLGFEGTPIPGGKVGHRKMALLTARETSSLRAELVFFRFMTSASGKALAPPARPENLDDDAQGRRQRAALRGDDPSWVQASGMGRIKPISQGRSVDREGKEMHDDCVPGIATCTVSVTL